MARTVLNTRSAALTGTGEVTWQNADLVNGNVFPNGGVVVPLIRVTGTAAVFYARFKAQVGAGPLKQLQHRDVALAAGSRVYVCELLDRYFYNTAEGMVEVDWLDANKAAIVGSPDIDIDLVRVADI